MDGSAQYLPELMSAEESISLFNQLQKSLRWDADQVMMFGKLVTTRRKVAWIGDPECAYTYSGVKKSPQAWTPELLSIKTQLEELTQTEFNSCLLNFYHDGNDGMGWHSDDEKMLEKNGAIASLSFGAERKFAFKHKQSKQTVSLALAHGSLLVMKDTTQANWLHRLPPTTKISTPRVNLTFRTIVV